MGLTIAEVISLVITLGGLISVVSLLYTKFITPIKKVMKQVEENTRSIAQFEAKLILIREQQNDIRTYEGEVKSLLLESLMAILETMEKTGGDTSVSDAKKKIFEFLSKKV